MTGPMDPERLAELRAEIADIDHHWSAQPTLEQLLADRDHWHGVATEALTELARLRERCGVSASDIEYYGLTRDMVIAWLEAHGFAPSGRTDTGPNGVTTAEWHGDDRPYVWVPEIDDHGELARVVYGLWHYRGASPWKLLTEMAGRPT